MPEDAFHILRTACARLSDLGPDDKDAIAAIGLAIEEALSDASQDADRLGDLAQLCLESLQAVYVGSAPDEGKLVAALRSVGSACRQLTSPSDPAFDAILDAAGQALALALGKEIEQTTTSKPDAVPLHDVTIDDAAAQLVQCTADDPDSLSLLQRMLGAIAGDVSMPEPILKVAGKCSETVRSVIDGEAADPEEALAEVGVLLQGASDQLEDLLEGLETGPCDDLDEEQPEVIAESQEPQPSPAAELPQPQKASPSSNDMPLPPGLDMDLAGEFVTECREYIAGAEAALLILETNPEDKESINTIFRAFHTIKGNAAVMGFEEMSELAHHAENLLSRMREGEIRCTGGYADLALRSSDVLGELLTLISKALAGDAVLRPAAMDDLLRILADPEAHGVAETVAETATSAKAEQPQTSATATEPAKGADTRQKSSDSASGAETSVRIRTDRLDKMIDMVGELVIAQSMVAQDRALVTSDGQDLAKKVIQLGKIVRELQYLGMSMRMVPLKPTFQKMARLARDVSRKSGKQVDFVTAGDDTEIDRNMVDVISDPLVHMVRNAVDHGIESPDERARKGKPKTGTVKLSAYHSGGNVVVELRDDGQGLDREKIVTKAVARGLIESDRGLSDSEVFNLVFEPGFSTAEKVTEVSGRGVGMDVVRRNVESLRGRIEITSQSGSGSTFSLQLPLTMAVTDGMLVRVGADRFILPTVNIRVSFRPQAKDLHDVIGQAELVMLRGEPMPLVRLHRLFHIADAVENPVEGLLVVMEGGERPYALLVDELLGQHHVVAKSLGDGMTKVKGISGAAILGDGRVGLILDARDMAVIARQTAGELGLAA